MEQIRSACRVRGSAAFGGVQMVEEHYRSATAQPRHWHGFAKVTLVISGSVEETVGGRTEVARALSILVKPAGVEHADRYGSDGLHIFRIGFDPQLLGGRADDVDSPLSAWGCLRGGPLVAHMLGLLRLMRHGVTDETEIERRMLDALACVRAQRPRPGPTAGPAWLERVREALDDASVSPPRVRDLAASAAVHPVYLARRFRGFYGCSITGYLRRRRVAAAAALLHRGQLPVSRVAHDAGFADQSHLCRVFKAGTGVTPLAYRRLATDAEV